MRAFFMLLTLTLVGCGADQKGPVELGQVDWKTDHDAAFAASAKSGKPVFFLFQEVPG